MVHSSPSSTWRASSTSLTEAEVPELVAELRAVSLRPTDPGFYLLVVRRSSATSSRSEASIS